MTHATHPKMVINLTHDQPIHFHLWLRNPYNIWRTLKHLQSSKAKDF